MDLQKSIVDFVIVTLPGVLLYFLGWVYLYYFLAFFGINPSELRLDTSTVFIYSYTPIYDTMTNYPVTTGLILLIVLLALFTRFFDNTFKKLRINFRKWISAIYARWIRHPSSLDSFWRIVYITVTLFLFILVTINFVLIPIAISSARLAANRKWEGIGGSIVINLNQEVKQNSSELVDDLSTCQGRGALVQIFSDEDTLFLLCRSSDEAHTGSVFEVKKDKGLVSSRCVIEQGG
jgi:hypothetical protein